MNFLISLIPTLLVLGLLILIHELGHFLACRMVKVRVEKFSIGFGPELFHWQGRETRYAISLLPLGGFVKPAGESASEVESEGLKPDDYLAASLPARIFIVISGILMNYLLAYVLFVGILLAGRPVPGTTIGDFVEGYPAEKSGLAAGDRIVQVNDMGVRTWSELTQAFEAAPAGALHLVIERRDKTGASEGLVLAVTPKVDEIMNVFGHPIQVKRLGITPHPGALEIERYGLPEALVRAWETEVFFTVMTHKAIFYLLLGKLSMKAISGPIGIITMTGSATELGLPYLLQLMATLSVSLAVINLLPIPALDGGHLLFLLIEAVRRKRVDLRFQERATQIGFALLMALMVVILYNDLVNINAFEKLRTFFRP